MIRLKDCIDVDDLHSIKIVEDMKDDIPFLANWSSRVSQSFFNLSTKAFFKSCSRLHQFFLRHSPRSCSQCLVLWSPSFILRKICSFLFKSIFKSTLNFTFFLYLSISIMWWNLSHNFVWKIFFYGATELRKIPSCLRTLFEKVQVNVVQVFF